MSLKLIRNTPLLVLVLALLFTQFITPVTAATSASYRTYLRGANEVAGGDPDGRGRADITIKFARNQVCYDLTLTGIVMPLTGAHIHVGAAGVAGPVIVNFPVDGGANLSDCVDVAKDIIKMIAAKPANFYVNVHNAEYAPGAMRGQLRKQ